MVSDGLTALRVVMGIQELDGIAQIAQLELERERNRMQLEDFRCRFEELRASTVDTGDETSDDEMEAESSDDEDEARDDEVRNHMRVLDDMAQGTLIRIVTISGNNFGRRLFLEVDRDYGIMIVRYNGDNEHYRLGQIHRIEICGDQ